MIMEMGVPVVLPSKTPDRICTRSASLRAVVMADCPGFLLSRYTWIISSLISMPAGKPSRTAPRAGPWDSPHVVSCSILPIVEPAIALPRLSRRRAVKICFPVYHKKNKKKPEIVFHPGF